MKRFRLTNGKTIDTSNHMCIKHEKLWNVNTSRFEALDGDVVTFEEDNKKRKETIKGYSEYQVFEFTSGGKRIFSTEEIQNNEIKIEHKTFIEKEIHEIDD